MEAIYSACRSLARHICLVQNYSDFLALGVSPYPHNAGASPPSTYLNLYWWARIAVLLFNVSKLIKTFSEEVFNVV